MSIKVLIFALIFLLLGLFSFAQNSIVKRPQRCHTQPPSQVWNNWFNQKVNDYKQNLAKEKSKSTSSYLIPVVFHIIYGNEAEGTYPNLDQAQIVSQINILNNDYAGIGFNTGLYSQMGANGHLPFYEYSQTNSLPAPDDNGVTISNTGISFILASEDPSGNLLPEPGIDRESYITKKWSNPASIPDEGTLMSYLDQTIKPNTIWDPTKYFNVWLTDENNSVQMLGYSTFPSGTNLAGLDGGGSSNANATTDGCWIWSMSCGDTISVAAPYNKGRTLTHESGHYLGLRHVWGDGNCLTDYCNDIPPAATANYVSQGTGYPYHVNTCSSAGAYNNNVDGEMFMNFMDYSDDGAMWMFTNDQLLRMHTALTQSTDRIGLTASANSMRTKSVAKISLDKSIDIYPNPTVDGHFNISVNVAEATNLQIVIENILGKLVFKNNENSVAHNTLRYQFPTFEKGIYFITIINSNGDKIVRKIVVQ